MSPTSSIGAPTSTSTRASIASAQPAGKGQTVPFAVLGVFGFIAIFSFITLVGKRYYICIKRRKAAAKKQRRTSRGKQSSRHKREGDWHKLSNKEAGDQTPLPTKPLVSASTSPATPPRSPAPALTPRLDKFAFLSRPEISSPLTMDPLSPRQSNEPAMRRPSIGTSAYPLSPILTRQGSKSSAHTTAERRVRQMRSDPKLSPVQKATPLL